MKKLFIVLVVYPSLILAMQGEILTYLLKKPLVEFSCDDIEKISDQIRKEQLANPLLLEMEKKSHKSLETLKKLSDDEKADDDFIEAMKHLALYARVTPEHFCNFWTINKFKLLACCETEAKTAEIALTTKARNSSLNTHDCQKEKEYLLRAQNCQEFLKQFDRESNVLCKPSQYTILSLQ